MTYTAEQAAYTAGLLDGEGSFVVTTVPTRHNSGRGRTHQLHVSIHNSSSEMLTFVRSLFPDGVDYTDDLRSKRETGLTIHRLSWTNARCIPILEAVIPYLITKRRVAKVSLEMARRFNIHGKVNHLDDEEIILRNDLQRQVYELNALTRSGVRSRTYVEV